MAAAPAVPATKEQTAWAAFVRAVIRIEREKIVLGRSARNALGVAIPLAIGYSVGSLGAGLVAAIHAGNSKAGHAMAQLGFQMITLESESQALRRGAAASLREARADR